MLIGNVIEVGGSPERDTSIRYAIWHSTITATLNFNTDLKSNTANWGLDLTNIDGLTQSQIAKAWSIDVTEETDKVSATYPNGRRLIVRIPGNTQTWLTDYKFKSLYLIPMNLRAMRSSGASSIEPTDYLGLVYNASLAQPFTLGGYDLENGAGNISSMASFPIERQLFNSLNTADKTFRLLSILSKTNQEIIIQSSWNIITIGGNSIID